MFFLPMIHTAWITAIAGSLAHAIVLSQRLATEEKVLFASILNTVPPCRPNLGSFPDFFNAQIRPRLCRAKCIRIDFVYPLKGRYPFSIPICPRLEVNDVSERFAQDRAIFITGGGSGLGRSMALRFSETRRRISLSLVAAKKPLKDVCDEIHRAGGSAAYATCDVRDPAAVEAAAAAADQQFGRIDTVVNNAAGNFMARTESLSPNAFNAVVGIGAKRFVSLHANFRKALDRAKTGRQCFEML